MAQSTKNLLAILLLITMIISFMGTLAAISSLINYRQVPVSADTGQSVGKVSVYVTPAPPEVTGKVTVNLESMDGG